MTEYWADEDAMDMREMFYRLWARRWWIATSVVVFTGILTAAAFILTPIYRASTVVISTSAERNSLGGSIGSALGGFGGLASLAGIDLSSGDAATQEALAVLRSRQFTERFIVDLDLMPKLFPPSPGEDPGKGTVSMGERPTLAKAFKYFDAKIRTITQDKKTGLIRVQIDWTHPKEAAAWANELVMRLNAEMRGRAIEKSEASVAFLEKELLSTSLVGTREAINRLIEVQIKQRMLANVTQEYAFRVVDRAMAPDMDDPIAPKKLLLMISGPVLGFLVGVLAVLAFDWLTRREAPSPA